LPAASQSPSFAIPPARCVTSGRQTASLWSRARKLPVSATAKKKEVGLTKIVPFLVEDQMLRLGATFSKEANWAPHVVSDGLLITGQNPHSSGPAAKTLMAALKQKAKPAASARAS
jgi:putative intracellular protease/amidase